MSRVDIATIRRQQIVEAAVAIIAEQGLENLSLSAIEDRADMSRGQLTYYFPHREDILLAVFDRLLELLKERAHAGLGSPCELPRGWEAIRRLLTFVVLNQPASPAFHSLQYTFLSQIGHRADFRQRLANLYEEWRAHMAANLAEELARRGLKHNISPRALATLIQAILHGLNMQRVADPTVFDPQEMLDLCLDLLGSYVTAGAPPRGAAGNGKPTHTGRRPPRPSRTKRGSP
jgi:AcrR family transcriptional regulator